MESTKTARLQQGHVIHMENRRKLDITGVNKVVTFNETTVVLHTTQGVMNLRGKDMKVNRLNVENGDMSIEGEFISMNYTTRDDSNSHKKGLLDKLLK